MLQRRVSATGRVSQGALWDPEREDVSIPSNSGAWSRTLAVDQACGDVRPCGAMRRAFGGSRRQRGEFAPFLPTQQPLLLRVGCQTGLSPGLPQEDRAPLRSGGTRGRLSCALPCSFRSCGGLGHADGRHRPCKARVSQAMVPHHAATGEQNHLGPQRGLPRSPGLSVQQAQLAGGTEPLELGAPSPGVCSSRREVPADGQASVAEMSDGGRMSPRRACFPPLGRSRRPEASGPRLRLPGTGSPREVAACA